MKREIDGFVVNRLQGALLEEAFRLVEHGHAGVEDVDVGIREGLALRWSFIGPFETIYLNAPAGVRDYADRYQSIYSGIFGSTQWRVDWSGPVMDKVESERRKSLAADRLGERQAWRDRRLITLAAHKQWADKTIGR
jgi:L-gulonate 3-dehydrogenase